MSIGDCGLFCIQLSWYQIKSPGVSHFEVTYVREDGDGATVAVDGSKTALNFTELVPGKAYHFSVVAVSIAGDIVGRSQQSNHIKFSGLKLRHSAQHYYYETCTSMMIINFFLCKGFDTRMKSMPLSGTLLADDLGTENFTASNCSILSNNKPISILWSSENFRNVSSNQTIDNKTAPELFYVEEVIKSTSENFFTLSRLTILNLTSDFDGVIVFCGTSEDLKMANFSLRVYCK